MGELYKTYIYVVERTLSYQQKVVERKMRVAGAGSSSWAFSRPSFLKAELP